MIVLGDDEKIPEIKRINKRNLKGTSKVTQQFKHNYEINTKHFKIFNKYNIKKDNSALRIMTWNVKYFTNVHNKPTFNSIIKVINTLKPDILGLTEATLGKNKFYSEGDSDTDNPDIIAALSDNYDLITMCNVSPSWYAPFFGAMLFIKKEIKNIFCKKFGYDYNIVERSTNSCFYNQRINSFTEPIPVNDYYYRDRKENNTDIMNKYGKNEKSQDVT